MMDIFLKEDPAKTAEAVWTDVLKNDYKYVIVHRRQNI
jgi:hypothetical protein